MIKITLVRHGETDWNKERRIQGTINTPLNDNGIDQAVDKGKELKEQNYKFDVCYSSPLDRAKDTAKLILSNMNHKDIDVLIDDRLIERDFGEFQGNVADQRFFDIMYNGREGQYERNEVLLKRLEDSLKEMCEKHEDMNILLVGHSHTLKGILALIDPNFEWSTHLGNLESIDILYEDKTFRKL